MSTRASIVYNDEQGIHLYDEMVGASGEILDEAEMHLELCGDDIEFRASPSFIDLKLPGPIAAEISNAMRAFALLREAVELHEGKEHPWLSKVKWLLKEIDAKDQEGA